MNEDSSPESILERALEIADRQARAAWLDEAFKACNRQRPGGDGRVWGRLLDLKKDRAEAGDIVEFRSATFSTGFFTGPEHTAVAASRWPSRIGAGTKRCVKTNSTPTTSFPARSWFTARNKHLDSTVGRPASGCAITAVLHNHPILHQP